MGAAKKFLLVIALALGVARPARAEAPVDLTTLRADPQSVTISGISSGAFMAVQFGVAWSSMVKGVAAIAGGPYYCSRVSAAGSLIGFGLLNVGAALGPCMKGPGGPLSDLTAEADELARAGRIDPPEGLKRQRIYIFHGYNDSVVAAPLGDLTRGFYEHYQGKASGALYAQTAIGAGHSFVVAKGGGDGLNACAANAAPFIDDCRYDQAGVVLQHFYGALVPPSGALSASVRPFDQRPFMGKYAAPDRISLADQGYVYVPKSCESGGCRLHLALHGCLQNAGGGLRPEGLAFLNRIGLNEWADRNGIIVLYPQTESSAGSLWHMSYPYYYATPFNPEACWDWWSYVTYDDSYVTKSGAQIAALKAMIDAVTRNGVAAPPRQAAFALTVTDTSHAGAALAWSAAPGAQSYIVYRAGGAGADFTRVGETAGLSYAEGALSPGSAYRWRVAPVVGGVEQTAAEASATTRARPAPCAQPGSCPLNP